MFTSTGIVFFQNFLFDKKSKQIPLWVDGHVFVYDDLIAMCFYYIVVLRFYASFQKYFIIASCMESKNLSDKPKMVTA